MADGTSMWPTDFVGVMDLVMGLGLFGLGAAAVVVTAVRNRRPGPGPADHLHGDGDVASYGGHPGGGPDWGAGGDGGDC